ncbi:site-specific integrase [Streptomyces sp. AC563]|nr:site-specific integrase [Streptomyces buecherae]
MGTFFKECEHPKSRWSKCPHTYKIRYRDAAGRQREETGFTTQDRAIGKLTQIYNERKANPASRTRAERAAQYGAMRFGEYATRWKTEQHGLADSSMRQLNSLLEHHLLPILSNRRMSTFDHRIVEGFIQRMKDEGIGTATQANAFAKLQSILLHAYRLGIYTESPTANVVPPHYIARRAVIPSASQLRALLSLGSDNFRLIAELMSGCGMRNGEAAAINVKNVIADSTYRITEQVNQTTQHLGRLKHRKEGEYRDVPLPRRVKETIERHVHEHGTVNGYLLHHPRDRQKPFPYHCLSNEWQRIKKAGKLDVPEGMTLYSLRHFFASNCLSRGIPITDVADWMGHRSVNITFKVYRHLMPGSMEKAARVLDLALAA